MLSFKEQFEKDLSTVFHNTNEFAEMQLVKFNRFSKEIPIVVDRITVSEKKNRSGYSKDSVTGVNSADAVAYIQFSQIEFKPKRGGKIMIDKQEYTIIKVSEAMGELILELQMNDE